MEMISEEELKTAFRNPRLQVFTDSAALQQYLVDMNWQNTNLLLMSSGTYDKIDLEALTKAVL
jgi:UDP-N-acetylmuramate: L-alanyl-gamma-D-glutamyl-meso-diaminopimelate ligase